VILLFIDGVGIGVDDPSYNPCCYSETGIFHVNNQNLPRRGQKYCLDAQLDIPGLPQSATGHTTLYTGVNAAKMIGKHLYGFPNQDLRNILHKHAIFVNLVKKGFKCKFINAFRPVFFTTPEIFNNLHMSATTEMNKYADLTFSDLRDIKVGKALYHDYTNRELRNKGFNLPIYCAHTAAEILIREGEKYDMILYEYFLTDFAGHARDLKRAIVEIKKVEELIAALVKRVNLKNTILITVSDHGNIEDLRTKSHTKNPAFLAIWNNTSSGRSKNFSSLLDIFPYIYESITGYLPSPVFIKKS
jgi:bisphosphoglycerate-independent phosphoglycerate mutase (AlkP superfamily)